MDVNFEAAVVASAAASAPLADFPALRKTPITFGAEVAAHFLKHTDEQTVIALEALRIALERSGLDRREQGAWGIVAAPQYIGRTAAVTIVDRFGRNGGTAVPTHCAAQYSINSLAGAASIVLGIRGPNLGVGGGPWSAGDALVSAMTLFDPATTPGVWLLMTAWDPELIPDRQGQPTCATTCHGVALALRPGATGSSTLRLRLPTGRAKTSIHVSPTAGLAEPKVSQLAASIEAAERGIPSAWSCRLPCGSSVELQLAAGAQQLRAAA